MSAQLPIMMKLNAKNCLAKRIDINIVKCLFILLLVFAQLSCSNGSNEEGPRIESVVFEENPDFVFAQNATLRVDDIDNLDRVAYTISTKPGNFSEDIQVTYTMEYLLRAGAVDLDNQSLTVSVFGLYADYDNSVSFDLIYSSGVTAIAHIVVPTRPFQSVNSLPDVAINQVNPAISSDFFLIQSVGDTPIIMDLDGETRWHAPSLGEPAFATHFDGKDFYVGLNPNNGLFRIALNGEQEAFTIGDERYRGSHHNIENGKFGLLNTITFLDGSIDRPESVLIEMENNGEIIMHWDFDQILSDHILANGEDPLALVQNGVDWFHMNSAIYDAADDSIIASSRENFVIKIDYTTGGIKWILGNPGKFWYTNYPNSLQPLALQITGNAPIGQHALSVTTDGRHLMLFNNGLGHVNLPDIGDSRTFSIVSIYEIDADLGTAVEIWSFDNQQQIYSDVCSSAYRTSQGDILINYAAAESRQVARLLVVNDDMEVLFDATIPKRTQDGIACQTAYNAKEISLNDLIFE